MTRKRGVVEPHGHCHVGNPGQRVALHFYMVTMELDQYVFCNDLVYFGRLVHRGSDHMLLGRNESPSQIHHKATES